MYANILKLTGSTADEPPSRPPSSKAWRPPQQPYVLTFDLVLDITELVSSVYTVLYLAIKSRRSPTSEPHPVPTIAEEQSQPTLSSPPIIAKLKDDALPTYLPLALALGTAALCG